MKKPKIALLMLAAVFAAAVLPAAAQQRTAVNSAQAARMLAGKHRFSLQWISWERFGTAVVANRRGVYSIKGEQKGRGTSDYLRIDGTISRIDAREFVFNGKVVMRVNHINGGEPCERDGEMIFRITGNRRYWRLQQMDNPCDQVTDYVDIFFR